MHYISHLVECARSQFHESPTSRFFAVSSSPMLVKQTLWILWKSGSKAKK